MKYYPPRFLFRRYELLKRLEGGRSFLEIGPGSFNLTRDLLRMFEHGILIDYNSEVEHLFNRIPSDESSELSLVIADFEDYEAEEQFSSIIACEVMEHVEKDSEFLAKAYRILEENGQLILSVPARRKYWSVHDEGVGHLRRYEKKDLTNLLQAAGFGSIEIVSYGFPFVNILRLPRLLLAGRQKAFNRDLSKKEQTKESGLSQYRVMSKAIGLICNKYTVAPLALGSSLFNRFDFSNGYIVSARKL